ncbi:cation efflux protein [Umbelopsis sp. PMI_123]|nr:cation efflux protein [Umbelopsis sp. PMI_123]
MIDHQHSERTPLLSTSSSGQTTPVNSRAPSTRSCVNDNSKDNATSSSTKYRLLFATIMALMFFVTELVAGYFANSLALMSDAFHLLSDVASFVVALAAIYFAEKPATRRHSYGFHRAEVIAALGSVLTIWILTFYLVQAAIERLRNPEPINGKLMCITASIGVVINIILAIVLGGHGHSHGGHSHDHDHDHGHLHADEDHHHHGHNHNDEEEGVSKSSAKQESNINLRAASLHVLGDLLASIGVLISSIILIVRPDLTIVDPICTFVFSILVLYTTYHLVKDSLAVLMEGTPLNIQPEAIERSILEIPGVVAVHDLHVWNLSPGKSSLTAHITFDKSALHTYDEILYQAQHVVCDKYGVHHSTLQLETDIAGFTSHCRPDLCTPATINN